MSSLWNAEERNYEPKPVFTPLHTYIMDPPEPTTIDNLDELARIIRTMTYGELTTLASEAGISAAHLHGWSMK